MTSGYILIVAMLVLGGVLATAGDRIGTKVGKARLSLFNLRPRNTATVVTIVTGSLISASTLGILFASSSSLRDGIFELDSIKRKLRLARADIEKINNQKSQVEQELAKTRTDQADAQQRLNLTNRNFQQAQTQLKNVSQQASVLRSEIKSLLAERQQLFQQRQQLNEQIAQLNSQVTQLNSQVTQLRESVAQRDEEVAKRGQTIRERDRELQEKNQTITERNQELQEKGQAIAQSEERLIELERQFKEAIAQREIRRQQLEQELTQRESQLTLKTQQIEEKDKQIDEKDKQVAFLGRQVETLEQYYQNYQALRQGNVALVRGQVLAFAVLRIVDPSAASQAVEQLLREANRTAVETTRQNQKDSAEPLVQIPNTQVEQLINQIKDGKDYVVRILSAGNYVEGEKQIQVFADAALNQVVYQAGDVLATISTDASTMTNEEIRQRLDQLLSAAQFRARRAGILGTVQVGDGRIATVIRFIEQLDQYDQPVDVRVIAQENTSTAGPLKMQLVAIQKGQVVFKS